MGALAARVQPPARASFTRAGLLRQRPPRECHRLSAPSVESRVGGRTPLAILLQGGTPCTTRFALSVSLLRRQHGPRTDHSPVAALDQRRLHSTIWRLQRIAFLEPTHHERDDLVCPATGNDCANPVPAGSHSSVTDAGELLRGLLGREPGTISGRSNTVLAIDGDHVLVATEHSSITTSSSVLDGTAAN